MSTREKKVLFYSVICMAVIVAAGIYMIVFGRIINLGGNGKQLEKEYAWIQQEGYSYVSKSSQFKLSSPQEQDQVEQSEDINSYQLSEEELDGKPADVNQVDPIEALEAFVMQNPDLSYSEPLSEVEIAGTIYYKAKLSSLKYIEEGGTGTVGDVVIGSDGSIYDYWEYESTGVLIPFEYEEEE